MELKAMLKEWRVLWLLLWIGIALVGLGPHYVTDDAGQVSIETDIKKGLDLKGGTRVLLAVQSNNTSEANVNQVKNILETRVSAFGLTETDIRTVQLGDDYKIQVEVASTNRTRLERLLAQEGSFESRMPLPVTDTRNFTLSENTYVFQNDGSGVTVNGNTYQEGDRFELDGTTFVYQNNSEGTANLEAIMYTGQDVEQVVRSDERVEGGQGGYQFRFPVIITSEAAENVRTVARNYDTVLIQNQPYLGLDGQPAQLRLYVDDDLQSSLNIAASFKRNLVTQPSISGGAPTAAEARTEMQELQSILESGRLPYPVQIESISTITSSFGGQFLTAAFISIVLSLIAVGGLIFVRYGDAKVSIPIVLTGSSEVFILLGVWFSTVATLDLASIAGIIAAVGTGVDDQIIITDESGRKVVRSWKERMKEAFFVIFTSAASTIGAMVPLVSPELSTLAVGAAGLGLIGYTLQGRGKNPHFLAIGALALGVSVMGMSISPSSFALQAVQGFAITTILGIMVGITISRPAYAKILEHLKD